MKYQHSWYTTWESNASASSFFLVFLKNITVPPLHLMLLSPLYFLQCKYMQFLEISYKSFVKLKIRLFNQRTAVCQWHGESTNFQHFLISNSLALCFHQGVCKNTCTVRYIHHIKNVNRVAHYCSLPSLLSCSNTSCLIYQGDNILRKQKREVYWLKKTQNRL